MARLARTAPTTAQRAPSRQETLPAASSWRSAQTPPPPASTASSPNPMQQSTPLILYHDHCSWLMQRFLRRFRPQLASPPPRRRRGVVNSLLPALSQTSLALALISLLLIVTVSYA